MKSHEFELELGESRFHLTLARECAELLPAFFPSARKSLAPTRGRSEHKLSSTDDNGMFEVRWTQPKTGRLDSRRLPSADGALFTLQDAIERHVIADALHLVALHGGAVSTSSGTCLALGDSGSGKSSTIFQLVELGGDFLCEEIALCDPETWKAAPYIQSLSLTESLILEATQEGAPRGRLHRLRPPIVRYEPLELPTAEFSEEPITRILLPRFDAEAAVSIEPLPADEALPEVLGYSFPPNLDTETQFDRIIALLEQAETLRFVYPNANAARRALAELFVF